MAPQRRNETWSDGHGPPWNASEMKECTKCSRPYGPRPNSKGIENWANLKTSKFCPDCAIERYGRKDYGSKTCIMCGMEFHPVRTKKGINAKQWSTRLTCGGYGNFRCSSMLANVNGNVLAAQIALYSGKSVVKVAAWLAAQEHKAAA